MLGVAVPIIIVTFICILYKIIMSKNQPSAEVCGITLFSPIYMYSMGWCTVSEDIVFIY